MTPRAAPVNLCTPRSEPGGADMAFKSILDRQFKYHNAVSTDIRKTFERIRREQQLERGHRDEKQPSGKLVKMASVR